MNHLSKILGYMMKKWSKMTYIFIFIIFLYYLYFFKEKLIINSQQIAVLIIKKNKMSAHKNENQLTNNPKK